MTFLSCLLVSALLLMSASSAIHRATSSLEDNTELISLLRARERAAYEAERSLTTPTTSSRSGVECSHVVGSSGTTTISREGCALKRANSVTSPPSFIVDGRLLHDPLFPYVKAPSIPTNDPRCASPRTPIPRSHGSVQSQKTHVYSEGPLTLPYRVPCNLSFPMGVSVGNLGDGEIEIYARGSIEIRNALSLEGPTTITALGDIVLETVVMQGKAALTVVSITGRVDIHAVTGSERITAWGRNGVTIPADLTPRGGGSSPQLQSLIPLSIRPTSSN